MERRRVRWAVRSVGVAAIAVVLSGCLSVTPASLPRLYVGHAVTIPMKASDPAVTWSATGLPDGLSIDPATGVISGTPTTPGSGTVTVTATKSADEKATKSYAVDTETPVRPLLDYVNLGHGQDVVHPRAISDDGSTVLAWRGFVGEFGLELHDGDGTVVAVPGTAAGNVSAPVTDGMSADGEVVAFDLHQGTTWDAYVWRRGDVAPTLLTPGDQTGSWEGVSADGSAAVFVSPGPFGDVNTEAVFARDLASGVTQQLTPAGGQYATVRLSPNGRYVAIGTTAALVAEDLDAQYDGYVVDRTTGALRLVTTSTTEPAAALMVSDDGSSVVYATWPGTPAGLDPCNVYREDLGTGASTQVLAGATAFPVVSSDLRYALYIDTSLGHLFRADLATGASTDLGTGRAFSPNLRFLLWQPQTGDGIQGYLWDLGPSS